MLTYTHLLILPYLFILWTSHYNAELFWKFHSVSKVWDCRINGTVHFVTWPLRFRVRLFNITTANAILTKCCTMTCSLLNDFSLQQENQGQQYRSDSQCNTSSKQVKYLLDSFLATHKLQPRPISWYFKSVLNLYLTFFSGPFLLLFLFISLTEYN